MSDYVIIQKDTLTAMGDAMRDAYGETKLYTLDQMIEGIEPIERDYTSDIIAYIEGNVSSFEFPVGLTSIGNYAFYDCTDLALTSLPEGITSIGNAAFQNCTNLALTSLPSSLNKIGPYAFDNCTNLTLTSLPLNLDVIDLNAFAYCRGLQNITFEGTPTSIDSSAFFMCTNLVTINVPWADGEVANAPWGATKATINYNYVVESNKTNDKHANDVLIKETTLTSIANKIREFSEESETMSVTQIPNKMRTLFAGDTANFCSFIERKDDFTWYIPDDTTSVRGYAFYYLENPSLTSLPNGITSIGGCAFAYTNVSLTSLPDGITSIGGCAFEGCENLALTSLPDGITLIEGSTFSRCSNLALTSLPSGLNEIKSHAFSSCSNLALTSLPSGLNAIGEHAFYNCTNLALTSLPEGITSIEPGTFRYCTKLSSMTLPSGITQIFRYAFANCTGLTEVTFNGTPINGYLWSNVFYGCDNLTTINVPWSEGEISGAPWGATNATINYNYK